VERSPSAPTTRSAFVERPPSNDALHLTDRLVYYGPDVVQADETIGEVQGVGGTRPQGGGQDGVQVGAVDLPVVRWGP
jgi:hypothetical protein